jgi:hypothetical protein
LRLLIPFIINESLWNCPMIVDFMTFEKEALGLHHFEQAFSQAKKYGANLVDFFETLGSQHSAELYAQRLNISVPDFSSKLQYLIKVIEKIDEIKNEKNSLIRNKKFMDLSEDVAKITKDVPLEYSILLDAFKLGFISEDLLKSKKRSLTRRHVPLDLLESEFKEVHPNSSGGP